MPTSAIAGLIGAGSELPVASRAADAAPDHPGVVSGPAGPDLAASGGLTRQWTG